ncbi:DNA-binding response regulator [Spirochaetia bacterium]|nr:DNA-binding response regulator [Spirochaetia bacterium]
MTGGTLAVSRALRLFVQIQGQLEKVGFTNVEVTGQEKDSLNRLINEKQPVLLLVESCFYNAGTPLMMGQLLKNFPKQNIAVVNVGTFPDDLAAWFIWRGVKSYVNLLEGYDEFQQGLQVIRQGKAYISPTVRKLMNDFPEWPDTSNTVTKRQMEILILICNGFIPEHIGNNLHVSRPTVNWHLKELYKTFHVANREEMVKVAFDLKLVTGNDLVFYDRENKIEPLPEWAVVKQKTNRRLINAYED